MPSSWNGRRRDSGAWRAWVVLVACMLGVWMPLAPGIHATIHAGASLIADHRPGEGSDCDADGGHAPSDERRPAGHHDGSDCPVCLLLTLAKRADLPCAGFTLRGPERLPEHVVAVAPACPPSVALLRDGEPRAPPRALAGA